jgi:hypothetical protein
MPLVDSLLLGKVTLLLVVHIVIIGKLKIEHVKWEKPALEVVLVCMR